ncbi:MazG nucleotide pyrophosphohydrolase domain-containing protein [Colwellia marinimaniae]|nr:MazG nucleotide pyrophosphohydrolase domain-containing protein [Colwellia marinimaniae]
MNLGELERLIDVVKIKIIRDQKGTWSKGSTTYLNALFDEINEVKEELSSGKQCFLEDELGDILWVYLCFVHNLEVEGKVSMSRVFERSLIKYSERVNGINNGDCWDKIKKKQKIYLELEQSTFTSTIHQQNTDTL